MANSLRFTFDDGNLFQNIEELEAKIKVAVDITVDYHALRATEHAKTEAPWHDRTGAARSGLHSVWFGGGNKHTIVLAHAVHYGIWLEVKFSGRDEIIMPTVRKTGRELMQSLEGLMGRL